MFIEQIQHKAHGDSLAILSQVRETYDAVTRAKAAGSYGSSLNSDNVAVGDYAMTNAYQYGRSAQDERQLIHYRGWTYSSIKPIASVIAGQPIRVARKSSRSGPVPRRTVKASSLGIQFLPRWLKTATPQSLDIYEDHPILDVFDEPNDIMTRWHLFYVTTACLELCGKCYWWLTTDKTTGKPCVWPVPPSWVQPVHTKERAFDSWLMMPGGTGQPVPIPRDEIVYFFYPDPGNPLGVVSPLAACSRMVLADDAIWEAQSRTFRQGIWPGYAVIAGEYIDEDGDEGGRPLLEREQRQQIYAAIRRAWGGVMNMSEPLILDALIKDIKKITNTPAEMDFMESSKMTKGAIQQTFGTNPSIMGEIDGLNRATAIAARWNFADFTVNPLIQMLSETLTVSIAKALADDDEKLFLWIEPYHPDEQSERRANYQTASTIGAKIRVNEARTLLCNLPPLSDEDGGEDFCQPAQKGGGPGQDGPPKGAEDAATAGVPNQTGEPGSDLGTQDQDSRMTPQADAADAASDQNADGKQRRITHSKATAIKAPSRIRQTSVERRDKRKRRQALYLKAHDRHEKKLVPVIKGLFLKQGVACMELLAKAHAEGLPQNVSRLVHEIYDGDAFTERLKSAVKPLLHATMAKGAASEWAFAMTRNAPVVKAADIDDILIDLPDEIREELASALDEIIDADFWDDVSETTKAQLVESLEEGIENNESLYELCCRIGDNPTVAGVDPGIFAPGTTFGMNPVLGNGPSTARAKLIARTETTGCMNRAHLAAIDSLVKDGIATGKSWSALDDIHTRDAHVDADEEYGRQNPIAVDEPFILHDEKAGIDVEAMYPGDMDLPPSQRCNCILPGNEVSGAFIAGAKSWYEGEVVEIVTSGGRRFSVTPHHGIVTEHGVIDAGLLNEGDKIVAYDGQVEGSVVSRLGVGSDQVNHHPLPIEQVFQSLRSGAIAHSSIEFAGALTDDFHGDGNFMHGQVEIVRPNRKLIKRLNSACGEIGLNFALSRVDEALVGESCQSTRGQSRDFFAITADRFFGGLYCLGVPGTTALSLYGSAVLLNDLPFEPFRVGPASHWNVAISDTAKKQDATVARFVSELLQRFTGDVSFDDGVNAGCVSSSLALSVGSTDRNASGAQPFGKSFLRGLELAGNRFQRLTSKVSLDDVVEIRKFSMAGHVYDLQSLSGLIVTNGLCAVNCRCLCQSVFPDDAEGGDEEEDQGEEGPDDTEISYEQASTTAIVKAVSESVMLSLKDWDESQHPRDAHGRFGSGSGVGGETFVSPNVADAMNVDQAIEKIGSERHKAMLNEFGKVDDLLGLKPETETALGAWPKDGEHPELGFEAENSTVEKFPAGVTEEELKVSAAMKGLLADQKSILWFRHNDDGTKVLHEIVCDNMTPKQAHESLVDKGLIYHTVVPEGKSCRIYVYDEGGSLRNQVKEFSEANHGEHQVHIGDGDFLGSWTSREEGAGKYRDTIANYAAGGLQDRQRQVADFWGLYDHWRANEVKRAGRWLSKDWDEEKHPRAADGKFGSGGSSGAEAKPSGGKFDFKELSNSIQAQTKTPPKTMEALHSKADHLSGILSVAKSALKIPDKVMSAAGDFVKARVHDMFSEHGKPWTKALLGAMLLAAAVDMGHSVASEEAPEYHIEETRQEQVGDTAIAMHFADALAMVKGNDFMATIKSAADDKEPTDADLPEILAQGKKLWAAAKRDFKVPEDDQADKVAKAVAAAVNKALDGYFAKA